MRDRPTTPRTWRLSGPAVVGAATVAYAAFASGLRPLTWKPVIAVLLPAVAVLVLAVRRHEPVTGHVPAATQRAVWLWGGLLAIGLFWEAWAFFHQPAWNIASYDHPSLSSLLGPYLQDRPVRFAMWALWLYAGIRLVRR